MTRGSWGQLAIPDAAKTAQDDWRFAALPGDGSMLARGWGRSYGDSCINSDGTHLGTGRLNRFISLDKDSGVLHCEAGLTLDEILQVIVPRGWFLPVIPGTRFVTLGGALANDVHGKNHHRAGSFGCHVRSFTLLRSDGRRLRCSAEENTELFRATIGGLGLTGLVVSVEITLVPISSAYMEVQDHTFTSLDEFAALSQASQDWDYTVSWIDCFARGDQVCRGIFTRARHAAEGSLYPGRSRPRLGVPFAPPVSLVNRFTVDWFNRAYFQAGRRRQAPPAADGFASRRAHYPGFFFPLDAIDRWNRIYGSRGFYQYQCVLPVEGGYAAMRELLQLINASGEASFLAVLKEFGSRLSPGLLSFPRPGLTLALDFPNRGEKTLSLLGQFDSVVRAVGGALYPAKDARMPADLFASGYPALESFREQVDPAFSSAFWRRVQ